MTFYNNLISGDLNDRNLHRCSSTKTPEACSEDWPNPPMKIANPNLFGYLWNMYSRGRLSPTSRKRPSGNVISKTAKGHYGNLGDSCNTFVLNFKIITKSLLACIFPVHSQKSINLFKLFYYSPY